ncbi:MAG: SRPBCC domain-containing protein [Prolixibacteraceae bacterium]
MENRIVAVEKLFSVTIDKVWKAITDKNEMKQWYFDLEEFKAEVGFKFQFKAGPNEAVQYLHVCEVTEVIPQKKLTYSWCYDGYSGISFVTFELFEKGEKTLLKLTHQGIDSFPTENPDFAMRNFEEGWNEIINNSLVNYLENASYKRSFSLNASDEKIFESILNIPLWWTEMFEGTADRQGGKFTVRFGSSVFKTMVVEELTPNKKIVWNVVDSVIDIPELNNKTEWIGTKISWEISTYQDKTVLELKHIGLTPKIECYTICENGWNGFTESLTEFINTGKGKPFKIG